MIGGAIYLTALCVLGLLVLWRGGKTEWRGLVLIALVVSLALIARAAGLPFFPLILGAELALMAGLIALAWKSPNPWPVFAAGFCLVVLMIEALGAWRGQENGASAMLLAGGVMLCLAVGSLARANNTP